MKPCAMDAQGLETSFVIGTWMDGMNPRPGDNTGNGEQYGYSNGDGGEARHWAQHSSGAQGDETSYAAQGPTTTWGRRSEDATVLLDIQCPYCQGTMRGTLLCADCDARLTRRQLELIVNGSEAAKVALRLGVQ